MKLTGIQSNLFPQGNSWLDPSRFVSKIRPQDSLQAQKSEPSGFLAFISGVISRFLQWIFCCKSSEPEPDPQEYYPVTIGEGGVSINNIALPLSTVAEIASYLPPKDLSRLARTCVVFHKLITSDETFVHHVMGRNWEALILTTPELMQRPALQRLAFTGYNIAQQRILGENAPQLNCGDSTTLVNLFRIPFFRTHRGVVLDAVIQDDRLLQYVSPRLPGYREIVMAVVRQNGLALEHASRTLKNNDKIVMEAVRQNGLALEHAGHLTRYNNWIAMAAVRQNALALEYTHNAFKHQFEVVVPLHLEAVGQNGSAIEHASYGLKADPEIVLAASCEGGASH